VDEVIPAAIVGNNLGLGVVRATNACENWEVDDETVAAARASEIASSSDAPPDEAVERPPFAAVVREHLERLYGFCIRLAGNATDGEDLVQETLIRALRAYPELRRPEHAKGWLFAIATNVWRDQLRARGRRIRTTTIDELDEERDDFSLFQTIAIEDPFPYSDELHLDFLRLFRDEDVQAVFGAINSVFRLPLILTVVHGFSCKEAAAVLDVPLGTLLSRLHRGRKQLERGLWEYAVANGLVTVSDEP
jgi:RNA polymerase sigma-70 factor (ECF subfamily)